MQNGTSFRSEKVLRDVEKITTEKIADAGNEAFHY
jgi:hypothetical protein